MKPIPVVFHIGPLQVHTYGIGLAITFWFGYRYFERRLAKRGYATDWLISGFIWIVLAAVLGARVLHILANLSFYVQNPIQIPAIWHGGLSSFGGIIFAIPTGIYLIHKKCPELKITRALDIVAPVLMASWSMGRLLGPQLMVAGGGHRTQQWFGMYYADQAGKRLPVPIFQSMEDFSIFLALIWLERRLSRWPDRSTRTPGYPPGAVIGTGMILWGIERLVDQNLWLSKPGHLGSILVQLAGVGLILAGLIVVFAVRKRWWKWLALGAPGGHGETDQLDDLESDSDNYLDSDPESESNSDPELELDPELDNNLEVKSDDVKVQIES